jgi:4-amino-4-deoxy-L-arabinose transferase-like glycosyltransferase
MSGTGEILKDGAGAAASPAVLSARQALLLQPQLERVPFYTRRTFFWICFFTVFVVGAFLRFWRLDQQAIWTDEAHTMRRINGSFDYMISQLDGHGFPPGWYALLRSWLLVCDCYYNAVANADGRWIYHFFDDLRHQRFTPNGRAYATSCLRMVPAFMGTMTVPAMYFLSRQFMNRQRSLLVMLLAAVNPFLIYYSRDLKMYAALALFTALSTALLLHWQTTRRHLLYLPLYIVATFCLTMTHPTAWAIVGLHAVMVLTRPRPGPLDGPLWVAGGALACWFGGYWYFVHQGVDDWIGRVSQGGGICGL